VRAPKGQGHYEPAAAVSNLAYQSKIGCGIPQTDEFKHHLFHEAADGRVCGFLLFHLNRPVAYALCRVEADIVTYTLVGYDPGFGKLSPGTVLLVLLIERLLAERRFALFDFGGTALDYKAFFATGSIDYVKVMWFPITAKYLILVLAHFLVLQASRAAARLKFCACTAGARIGRHLRVCPPKSAAREPRYWRVRHRSSRRISSGHDFSNGNVSPAPRRPEYGGPWPW